jgi:hypothetical protein
VGIDQSRGGVDFVKKAGGAVSKAMQQAREAVELNWEFNSTDLAEAILRSE